MSEKLNQHTNLVTKRTLTDVTEYPLGRSPESKDPVQARAKERVRARLEEQSERVFFTRQLEIAFEDEFFHWITSRALRELVSEGMARSETRELSTGGIINLYWNKSYRYYKREASAVVRLVEEYADPNIGAALGLQGEALVLEGFARNRFLMGGRSVRDYAGLLWDETEHDLDFIFEKDGEAYGLEVKNTLTYMDYTELKIKIRLCKALGITPVFAVRMLPRIWIGELMRAGGFALIMKYQLYPWAHRELAKRVATELGLPVDSPRALEDGTMRRFTNWHEGRI